MKNIMFNKELVKLKAQKRKLIVAFGWFMTKVKKTSDNRMIQSLRTIQIRARRRNDEWFFREIEYWVKCFVNSCSSSPVYEDRLN